MKKSDEFLSLRGKLTLIEPEFGPWGPELTPKVVLIWSYFLDFSLNPKLDTLIGYTNPTFVPEGPPIGPNPTQF